MLGGTVDSAVQQYRQLDFFTPANNVRSFVWNYFAPHYLEMVKGRAYNGDEAACWTLHEVLRTVLLLLAPIAPFSSYYYAGAVYGIDVHRAKFPAPTERGVDQPLTDAIVAFNSQVWKTKQEQGLSLGAPVKGVVVPPGLKEFEFDLREMHKLE
jgi:valyl-tRNA synthetase